MNKDIFNDALNYLDYDLVEEFVSEREKNKKSQRIRTVGRVSAAAASLVVLTLIVPIIMVITTPSGSAGPPMGTTTVETDGGSMFPNEYESAHPYLYYFAYNKIEYLCEFGEAGESFEEALDKYRVDAAELGEYIGEVKAVDKNGKAAWYKIYKSKDAKTILIEIREGYYFKVKRL